MKAIPKISAVAVFLIIAPSLCFALWVNVTVTRDLAKELGMEVRTKAAGPNNVHVELEFKTEGRFGAFNEERFKHRSGVELRIGEGDDLVVSAPLREDRSQPGRVMVNFTAHRTFLDQTNLRVMAAESDGGINFDLRVKDFVDPGNR
jgi:hypothetical protein